MKKLAMLCCAFFMISGVLLSGCTTAGKGTAKDTESTTDKIQVMATVFAPYDYAKQILGEYGEVSMLLPPAVESHSYEPTPQDIIRIQNSDVFIYAGGESDTWVKEILKEIDTGNMKIISLMECIHGEDAEESSHHSHDEQLSHNGEEHDELLHDEHVWTSPKNAITIANVMTTVFAETNPANATAIKEQGEDYVEQLQELDRSFEQVVEQGAHKTIIFGDRFPLVHFANAYSLEYYAAFPGCAEDTEPSAATLAFLIDKVKEEDIPVVFHIELSNQGITDTIVRSTMAEKRLFHTCHNVSKDDFEQGVTYVSLMQKNVEVLKEALGKK